jgi:endo-1,4-beta-xylanase
MNRWTGFLLISLCILSLAGCALLAGVQPAAPTLTSEEAADAAASPAVAATPFTAAPIPAVTPTAVPTPTATPTPTAASAPTAAPTPTRTPAPAADRTLRRLADLHGLHIGAAVQSYMLLNDSQYAETIKREFNILTPEFEMKFDAVQPARGVYDFAAADRILAFAEENGMLVRGHALVWHSSLPDWIEDGEFSREEAIGILRDHIMTVVGRYRGHVYAWDVVNEAIDDSAQLRDSVWLRWIGPEYIAMAFQWAHEADPDALLFYNDYGIDGLNDKSDAAYNLILNLLSEGVPIHGIGLQMHLRLDRDLPPESVLANMERFGEAGLDVHITEMDLRIADGEGSLEERYQQQAEIYRSMLEVCLLADPCTAFVTWGFTDRYAFMRRFDPSESPLLFDEEYRPKPAYDALISLLLDFPG